MSIPLGSYTNEPVTIRLDDTDTHALKVVPAEPGFFKLAVKAKGWVPFANGADRPAAQTDLTVTIGSQCFAHAATKKTD